MNEEFTLSELYEAIRAASDNGPEDARTCVEWAERMGCGIVVMRRQLSQLIQAGHMEHVKVKRMKINGVYAPFDAYRIKEPGANNDPDNRNTKTKRRH